MHIHSPTSVSALDRVLDAITQADRAHQQEEVKNPDIRQELLDLMAAGKCIPCTYYNCPGIRSDGTSSNESMVLFVEASGYIVMLTTWIQVRGLQRVMSSWRIRHMVYEGACIDCTRYDDCGTPMWD